MSTFQKTLSGSGTTPGQGLPVMPRNDLREDTRLGLNNLVAGVRAALGTHANWQDTARLVGDQLRAHLPAPEILTTTERHGDPVTYASQTLHIEPDGSFSIVGLVWQPGQITRIHDHLTWCVFGVIQGIEHEELFDTQLNLIGQTDSRPGDVNGFAPPGDVHRIHNVGSDIAISIHIYGTDVSRVGSSVRRYYEPAD